MKQVLLLSKTLCCFLFFQFMCSATLSAQGAGNERGEQQVAGHIPPAKQNWLGFAEMTLSESGNICVIPYTFPNGDGMGGEESYFYLRTVIFLADDNMSAYDPLYFYYNLPNGESDIIPVVNNSTNPLQVYLGEMTESISAEFGEVPPVDYCAMFIFAPCMPVCEDYEGCGEFSYQLLTQKNGYGFVPYPIGNGLFPSEIFQSDEFGNTFHYTEYKEICCSADAVPSSNNPDPCNGVGGTTQITPAPDPYPLNTTSPCNSQGLGLLVNQDNIFGSAVGQVLEEKKTETQVSLFPNPSSTDITIQYKSSRPGQVQFDCMDFQGRVIKSTKRNGYHKDVHQETFDVSSWQSGIYFIKISSPDDSQVIRFVKSTP
ncbi:MAG TPA: T9SS type A sorting domain-containing protein [Bacteroidetes bacterium]|nr:T9SS type A sorting domain-containing protein [Bacteroidota bacterium]